MKLHFIAPANLKPTEQHDRQALADLLAKIERDREWQDPILVHTGILAILDGHHRHQVAIQLGLAVIPCLAVSYLEDDIELGSWHHDYYPEPEDVFRAAISGHLLPYKTTRHRMPQLGLRFAIPLELLRAPKCNNVVQIDTPLSDPVNGLGHGPP